MKPTVTIARSTAWSALALWLVAANVTAGSFQVNPIRIELAKGATTAAMTVHNDGDDAVVIQASVLSWSQDESGQDVYAPTNEALVTPPIMTILPGGEQIVRIGMRRPPDPQRELTYRLYLAEVPPPPKPGFTGLQVALRVGVPVFVLPPVPAIRRLEWSAQIAADGAIRLGAQNTGNAHVQVTDFELGAPGSAEPFAQQTALSYVLAGQHHVWTLPVPADRVKAVSTFRLKAFTDAGEIDTPVNVER